MTVRREIKYLVPEIIVRFIKVKHYYVYMVKETDLEAVQDAIKALKDNGFNVEGVDRVFGYEEHDYDPETEEEEHLGRMTKIDLAVEKKHY